MSLLVVMHRPPRSFAASGFFAISLLLAGVAFASGARAQTTSAARHDSDARSPLLPMRVEGHGSLTWDGELGVGARIDFPIIDQGLLYSTRDELALSFGADVIFASFEDSEPLSVWPTAAVQWSLGVSERFAFYPELGLAALIEKGDGWGGVLPNVGFGGRYYVWRSVSLMGRLGWPMALSLGATF